MTSLVEVKLRLPREKTKDGGHRVTDEVYNERWIARVRAKAPVDANGCWVWQGSLAANGYGQTNYRDTNKRVHRTMFMLANGPIPDGHDVCHTCDVRRCVNPAHLFSGTRKDNHDDMWAKGRAWQQKDACRRGHPYAVHGRLWTLKKGKTWRSCSWCNLITQRTKNGWPLELAESVPPLKMGYTWKHYVERGAEVVRG